MDRSLSVRQFQTISENGGSNNLCNSNLSGYSVRISLALKKLISSMSQMWIFFSYNVIP